MESLQTTNYLDENVPDFLLFDIRLSLLIVGDFLEDVTIICVLHDET